MFQVRKGHRWTPTGLESRTPPEWLTPATLASLLLGHFLLGLRFRFTGGSQQTMAQGALFHQGKEHGHENQNVNGRGDHSSHDRSRNGLHDVRTDSRLPQNRD